MLKPYYETDNGKLYNGDCLEIMPELDIEFDMVLTDPPYGITNCEWDIIIPFELMWENINKLIKINTPVALFGTEPFSSYLRISNIKKYKYDWVWDKKQGANFAGSKKQPLRRIEFISMFYKKQPFYNSVGEKRLKPRSYARPLKSSPSATCGLTDNFNRDGTRKYFHYTHKTKHNLISIPRDKNKSSISRTQKPVKLIEYLIGIYTNKKDIVLDFTSGSGTTGLACENLNRRWIMVEKDEYQCEQAAKRIEKETRQLRLFA